MSGLSLLMAAAIYVFVLYIAAKCGKALALRLGFKGFIANAGAALGFFAVFLPVFWDALPAYYTFNKYCAAVPEFKIYKTSAQWETEHEAQAGRAREPEQRGEPSPIGDAGVSEPDFSILGSYFNYRKFKTDLGFTVSRVTTELVDAATGEVLISKTKVFASSGSMVTGQGNWWKLWMPSESCEMGGDEFNNALKAYSQVENELRLGN